MPRPATFCGLGLATRNEACSESPAYRVEAPADGGRRVNLYLCSRHIHRAWELAQLLLDKKHRGEGLKVRAIHLHQLPKSAAAAAEAAS